MVNNFVKTLFLNKMTIMMITIDAVGLFKRSFEQEFHFLFTTKISWSRMLKPGRAGLGTMSNKRQEVA